MDAIFEGYVMTIVLHVSYAITVPATHNTIPRNNKARLLVPNTNARPANKTVIEGANREEIPFIKVRLLNIREG